MAETFVLPTSYEFVCDATEEVPTSPKEALNADDLVMVSELSPHEGWHNRAVRILSSSKRADGKVAVELFVEPFERVWMKPTDLVGPIADMSWLRTRCLDMPEADIHSVGSELYKRYKAAGRVGVWPSRRR